MPLSITKINYFSFVFPFGGGYDILRAFGAWKMKIKGFYILTRRSVMRMISILGIVLGSLYAEATAESKVFSSRVEDVQVELISLKKRLPEDSSRAQLPDVQYLEYKSVYLEAKRYTKEHENPTKTDATGRVPPVMGNVKKPRSGAAPATKADLRAAVKTIIRGEDVFASKPGPRITPAKQRQIDAAKKWRATHAGCSLHNACIRSFVPAKGGYKNAAVLYSFFHRRAKS